MSLERAESLMRRTPDATRRPPKPPTRLNPSAMRNVRTAGHHSPDFFALRRDVSSTRAHRKAAVLYLHLDFVPASVLFPWTCVPKVILLAQLVGEPRRGAFQVAEAADDFRSAPCVIRDVAERVGVHTFGGRRSPAPAEDRRLTASTASARHGERKRHWQLNGWSVAQLRRCAIDAQGVHQDLAFANEPPELVNRDAAVRVVPVGDDKQRLLRMTADVS